ncbi:MAG: hypothetical protein WCG14_00130 [Chlamydiia bacterium]
MASSYEPLLPPEAKSSHFDPQLRALLHNLYALGMTEPGLIELEF